MAKKTGKVGGTDLSKLVGIGLAKPLMETMVAQTPVGNGNLMSGLLKCGGGYGISKYTSSKWADIGSIALFVDGVEDLMANFGILSMLRGMGGQIGGIAGGGNSGRMKK